jgi:hypothetical protein
MGKVRERDPDQATRAGLLTRRDIWEPRGSAGRVLWSVLLTRLHRPLHLLALSREAAAAGGLTSAWGSSALWQLRTVLAEAGLEFLQCRRVKRRGGRRIGSAAASRDTQRDRRNRGQSREGIPRHRDHRSLPDPTPETPSALGSSSPATWPSASRKILGAVPAIAGSWVIKTTVTPVSSQSE